MAIKIQKASKLKESKLTEKQNPAEDKGVVDGNASTDQIADVIMQSGIDNGEPVTKESAKKAAAEVKDVANKIEATDIVADGDAEELIGTENRLTKILDKALRQSKKYNRLKDRQANANVLVTGLPGSGKTAIIYDWAKKNGVNIFYLDAKNPDLISVVSGTPLRDTTTPNKNAIAMAFSKILEPLDRPNSVLFLDELNRQTKEWIRGALLTVIQDKAITGDGPDGTRRFPNFLFTVAAINPSVESDPGASKLNAAEKSRFVHKVQGFNSSANDTADYFRKSYLNSALKRVVREDADSKAENLANDMLDYLKSADLGLYIVNHPDFKYDTEADLDDLADRDANILAQRSLSEGIRDSDGDAQEFIEWIEEESGFLQRDQYMLIGIVSAYSELSERELFKKYSKEIKAAIPAEDYAAYIAPIIEGKAAGAELEDADDDLEDLDREDDEDAFSVEDDDDVISKDDVMSAIDDISDTWINSI